MILNIAQQKSIAIVSNLFIVGYLYNHSHKCTSSYTVSVSQNGSKYLQHFQVSCLGGNLHNLPQGRSQGRCYSHMAHRTSTTAKNYPLQNILCTLITYQKLYRSLFSLKQSVKVFNHHSSLGCLMDILDHHHPQEHKGTDCLFAWTFVT